MATISDIENIYLPVLVESIADTSYVNSDRSEDAYRICHAWLNSKAKAKEHPVRYEVVPETCDSLNLKVQVAVVTYARLRSVAATQ